MNYTFKIGNIKYTHKSVVESSQILRKYQMLLSSELENYYIYHKSLLDIHNDNWIIAPIVDIIGGQSFPSILIWDAPRHQIQNALRDINEGNIRLACINLHIASNAIHQQHKIFSKYVSASDKGSERAVTTLEFIRDGAIVVEGVLAGGLGIGVAGSAAIGAGYGGIVATTQQATEVHFDLKDRIDWVGIGSDTVISFFLSIAGSKYTEVLSGKIADKMITNVLLKNIQKIPRDKIAKAISTVIIGRSSDVVKIIFKSAIDRARNVQPRMTWHEFLNTLTDQFSRSAIFLDLVGYKIEGKLPK